MQLTRTSPISDKDNTFEIKSLTPERLKLIRLGHDAYTVCPGLSRAEKDFIETGMTPEESGAIDSAIDKNGMGLTQQNPTDKQGR